MSSENEQLLTIVSRQKGWYNNDCSFFMKIKD